MIYCLVKFGACAKRKKDEAERLVDDYLSSMLLNWQIYDDYYLTWMSGILYSHVFLARPDSYKKQHNSKWCKEKFEKITAIGDGDEIMRFFADEIEITQLDKTNA